MKYKCKMKVSIDQVDHEIGEIIDIDSDLADELLKTGCIEPTITPFFGSVITTDEAPPAHTKLGGAFHTMVGAANEVRTRINDIDSQLESLNAERQKLLSENVSKADYLDFIRSDIERRSAQYEINMIESFNRKGITTYSRLDRLKSNRIDMDLPYLTGNVLPFDYVSEAGMFFLFGEQIIKRIGDILNKMDWPENIMPVCDRAIAIVKINNNIAILTEERDELVDMLSKAGLIR